MRTTIPKRLMLATLISASMTVAADQAKTETIKGVKGVKQEAVESVKKVEPPAKAPAAVTTPQGVNEVDGVNRVKGVTQPGQVAPPPPPPTAQGVNQAEGIKAMVPDAAKPVPANPAGVVSTIRAVEGVQGIVAPKRKNLEAALLIKTGGEGTPAVSGEGGKGAAAAALLSAPRGLVPAPPVPNGDGRDAFQQFEKQTAPGS